MGLEFSCGENPALVPAVATPYGSSGLTPDQYVDHMEKALQGANTTRARSQPMTRGYRGGEARSRELRARTSDTPGTRRVGVRFDENRLPNLAQFWRPGAPG